MRVVVASEAARICGTRIRNRTCSVWRDYVDVKIDEPFPGNVRIAATHSVGGMTRGTREAVIDVPGVLGEARVCDDLVQIVALRAHRVGTVHAEIGAGIEIGDKQPAGGSLAELITAFKKVCPLGTVRSVRSTAAKFAIVIAIVALNAFGRVGVLVQRNWMHVGKTWRAAEEYQYRERLSQPWVANHGPASVKRACQHGAHESQPTSVASPKTGRLSRWLQCHKSRIEVTVVTIASGSYTRKSFQEKCGSFRLKTGGGIFRPVRSRSTCELCSRPLPIAQQH